MKHHLETDDISHIWPTDDFFLVLVENKKVVAWGECVYGADIYPVTEHLETDGISEMCSRGGAFWASLENKKVVAWGFHDDVTELYLR